jgi:CrcB protein
VLSVLPVAASVAAVTPRGPHDFHITLVVAAGGVLGALCRWWLTLLFPWHPPEVPTATLVANLVGCALIGALLTIWTEGPAPAWWVRPFGAVGFVGGFTTFSAFALEGVRLLDAGATVTAVAYLVGSVVAGLAIVVISSRICRWWLLRSSRGGA